MKNGIVLMPWLAYEVPAAMNDDIAPALGDALFQNLPVLGLLVVEQRVHIHRLVELAHAGVNSHLPEERFHAEGARLVGNDGHDQLADLRVAQQFGEHAHEHHRGGDLRAFACPCRTPRTALPSTGFSLGARTLRSGR